MRISYEAHTKAVVKSAIVRLSEDLGPLIQSLRQHRGLSQSELAERLDVSKSQISQIETGYYTPSLGVLETILEELDASLCVRTEEGVIATDPSGLDLPPAPETC